MITLATIPPIAAIGLTAAFILISIGVTFWWTDPNRKR
jgi:cbb3-type cytochrome oxidase subunit 3